MSEQAKIWHEHHALEHLPPEKELRYFLIALVNFFFESTVHRVQMSLDTELNIQHINMIHTWSYLLFLQTCASNNCYWEDLLASISVHIWYY